MKKLLLALLLCASPALADITLPPARYDIGGDTMEEALANFYVVFGDSVEVQAMTWVNVNAACDKLSQERWHINWPPVPVGESLMGCSIAEEPFKLVYPTDYSTVQVFRHEVGHILGWPNTHPRD
jgi:hypothetical protein